MKLEKHSTLNYNDIFSDHSKYYSYWPKFEDKVGEVFKLGHNNHGSFKKKLAATLVHWFFVQASRFQSFQF